MTPPSKAPPPSVPAEVTSAVASGQHQYLVARRPTLLPAGVPPLALSALLQDPGINLVRRLTSSAAEAAAAGPPGDEVIQEVFVLRMSPDKASEVDRHPEALVEEDHRLDLAPVAPPAVNRGLNPETVPPPSGSSTWSLSIQGDDGGRVAGATVYLYGSGYPVQAVTGADGRVDLTLPEAGPDVVRALFVNPQTGYWDAWFDAPQLVSPGVNQVTLTSLSTTLPQFPRQQISGWGQRAMRLDRLPPGVDGAGVKVAVIDSGADPAHPDLGRVEHGMDFTQDPPSPTGWSTDVVSHGSHCTGVIAGADDATGIRGFAPRAEIHALKIFPGGRFSSLLDALDYCIANGIDVVNLSLGSGASSDIVLRKFAQAKAAGVACIVAAGNSGDDVQFPATSPDVLAVAAIGKVGEFPSGTFHARQQWSGQTAPTAQGFFAATFSCHGPAVAVCAPGVAVISSVPGGSHEVGGFAAWDGTSMAAPHVTGLAALVLAHHPDFRARFAARDAGRVDRLFALLRGSATAVDVGDAARTGSGLPDAPRALELTSVNDGRNQDAAALQVRQLLDQLETDLVATGLIAG
jgi:subtilisin family serine protease